MLTTEFILHYKSRLPNERSTIFHLNNKLNVLLQADKKSTNTHVSFLIAGVHWIKLPTECFRKTNKSYLTVLQLPSNAA